MNSAPLSFLCVGSATQDVYLSNVDHLNPVCVNPEECFYNVRLGDKIYVNHVDYQTGGGASNAATTFARGGQLVTFMGKIGHDPAGAAVLKSFATEGIDYAAMAYSDDHNTDYSTLLLAPNGERTILTYRGCGMYFTPEDFDFTKLNRQVDWIYLTSLVGNFTIYDKVMQYARANHCKIAFNPGGRELEHPDQLKALLPNVEILSVNKQEAQQIVSGDTLEDLARELRKLCPVVIITDGANGALVVDRERALRAGLYKGEEMSVDRTGAGDAFCSGFTLRYALGDKLEDAILFAAANSSSVIQHVGAKPGILRGRPELEPLATKPVTL